MKKIKIFNTQTQSWQDISAGQTGPQGATGATGATGAAGNDGITPVITVTQITGGHNIAFSYGVDDPKNVDFNIMDGAQGIQGIQGQTGATGAAGADGADGSDGADGITPIVTITNITGGHNIDFSYGAGDARNTNVNIYDGVQGNPGTNGTNGTDGHSPVITATKSNGVTTVYSDGVAIATINDGSDGAQGTPGTNGTNGTNGTDGDDGITPVVTVTSITGGHNVAFSYGTGDARNTDFNVMDGEAGSGGGSYTAGTGIDITNGVISLAVDNGEEVQY